MHLWEPLHRAADALTLGAGPAQAARQTRAGPRRDRQGLTQAPLCSHDQRIGCAAPGLRMLRATPRSHGRAGQHTRGIHLHRVRALGRAACSQPARACTSQMNRSETRDPRTASDNAAARRSVVARATDGLSGTARTLRRAKSRNHVGQRPNARDRPERWSTLRGRLSGRAAAGWGRRSADGRPLFFDCLAAQRRPAIAS